MEETRNDTFPFSSRPVTKALENFECPLDAQTSTFLLLCLQNVILILFRVKQLFKNVTKRSALRQESYVWQGYGQVSIMVVTSHGSGLHPLTSVNVKKLTECLKKVSLDPAAEPENPSVLVSVAPIM